MDTCRSQRIGQSRRTDELEHRIDASGHQRPSRACHCTIVDASRGPWPVVSHSFNQAANALVTAALNLGYTAAEVQSIRQVLTARGFTVTV